MPIYRLIDTHSHIEEIKNLDLALKKAGEVGIVAIVGVGSDYESSKEVLKISETHRLPKIYPAIGIHPLGLELSELFMALELMRKNIDRVVAVGEIGLDYWIKDVRKDEVKRKEQKQVFKTQLEMANEYSLPVIVHSRGAWRDSFDIVKQFNIDKVVFHWYSGPTDVLSNLLEKGYFISATPAAQYSKEHREAIRKTPLENLLLETDSPVNYKLGEEKYESEPVDLVRTLQAVSEIKGINESVVADKTTENGIKFFNLK